MQHVLSETPSIIHALENYYGFGYPWDKLDVLAAPDFAAGAMENAGLVTFRDWLLLLDKDSPARNVQGSFNVTAHELAHQWTGDTVTTAWWNDIWLNEAFATWMQQKVTMEVHPEYRADLDRVRGAQGAMRNDSLVSARRITQPITGNGDIMTAFDGITYQKGASVIGMFENYVGEKTFQQGMRAYIQKHKFGNAVAERPGRLDRRRGGQGRSIQAGVPQLSRPVRRALRADPAGAEGRPDRAAAEPEPLPAGGQPRRQHSGCGACRCACATAPPTAARSAAKCSTRRPARWCWPAPASRPGSCRTRTPNGYYRFSLGKAAAGRLGPWRSASSATPSNSLMPMQSVPVSRHGDLDAGDVLAALKPLTDSKIL